MLNNELSGKPATVLIVDDEEMLVELLKRMIIRHGYNAISAVRAQEALEIYEQKKDDIDLVITDLVMPDMGGRALAEELLRRNPNIKILISTGFSAVDEIQALIAQGVKGVVMKPYESDQLNSSIKEALKN
jgi:DNA-binding NtrC family response regulator